MTSLRCRAPNIWPIAALLAALIAITATTLSAVPAGARPAIGQSLRAIPVGVQPRGLAFDPGHHLVYVANAGSATVSVINEANDTVIATIPLPAGSRPEGVAWNPNTRTIWVANNNGTVSVINGAAVKTFPITLVNGGGVPSRVVVDPNPLHHTVFVGLWLGYIVSINDVTFMQKLVYSSNSTTHIQLGAYDSKIGNGLLYASAWDTHAIYEIDATTGHVAAALNNFPGVPTVPEVDSTQASLFTGGSGHIYAFGGIGTPPGALRCQIPQGASVVPADFAIDSPDGVVYAAEGIGAGNGQVLGFNEANCNAIGAVAVGVQPYSIVVDPAEGPTGTLFTSNAGSNTVTAITAR